MSKYRKICLVFLVIVGDLQGIEREGPVPVPNAEIIDWNWVIEANQGSISFRATGYKQYLRRAPIRLKEQGLEQSQRGGLSFERGKSSA